MTDREIALACLKQLDRRRAVEYQSWLAVGMALHAAGCAVEDWRDWFPDGRRDHDRVCRDKWRSFGQHPNPRGIASLVAWCREDGGTPPKGGRNMEPDTALTWESEIGPAPQPQPAPPPGSGADYSEPVPPPSRGPVDELAAYLDLLFRPDEVFSYVLEARDDGEGRFTPFTRGVYTRTAGEVAAELRHYRQDESLGEGQVVANALGTWNEAAGGWCRINPMNGQGVRNIDVADHRHVLVESDAIPVERQLATIYALRLPCTAIVHSGGKSIHALVRIDAGSGKDAPAIYRERVGRLFEKLKQSGFPVDEQCRNPARLSRLPGLTRNGKRQYLVSGPCGAASWDEWEAGSRQDEFRADILDPARIEAELPDDNLLGNRFLTRRGSWLIVAQSGVGKSVLAMQGAVSFAVGRDLFGLAPARPLRQLVIQAENNPRDVQEAYNGVCKGIDLTGAERELLDANLRVVQADRYTGETFAAFLDWLCKRERPEIVWIDPLLAYIGGEISRMADCAKFLRNALNPVIHDNDIGVIMMHHTGKPPKGDDKGYKGADLAYLGIGSSDLTNWARATSALTRVEDCANRYTLAHIKRGNRAGCEAETDIMHAASGITWIMAPGARPQPEPATRRQAAGRKPEPPRQERKAKTPSKQRSRKAKAREEPKPETNEDKVKNYTGEYSGMGFEYMPPLKHNPRNIEESPLMIWIRGCLAEHGIEGKKPDSVRRTLSDQLIEHDKKTGLWRGLLYEAETSWED